MSETLEKVAVQTEESRTQTRRAFIKGGLAVAGTVMFTKAADAAYDPKSAAKAYAGKKELTEAFEDGPARRMLGKALCQRLTACLQFMKKKFVSVHWNG
jgi:sulfane dehydrogenase subunit SoxC